MDPNWEILFMLSPSRWFRAEGQLQFSASTAGKHPVGCSFVFLFCKSTESTACKVKVFGWSVSKLWANLYVFSIFIGY